MLYPLPSFLLPYLGKRVFLCVLNVELSRCCLLEPFLLCELHDVHTLTHSLTHSLTILSARLFSLIVVMGLLFWAVLLVAVGVFLRMDADLHLFLSPDAREQDFGGTGASEAVKQ